MTQPLELPARPADDIGINPLEGRAQLRPIEVAVVVDPAFDIRIVRLGQTHDPKRTVPSENVQIVGNHDIAVVHLSNLLDQHILDVQDARRSAGVGPVIDHEQPGLHGIGDFCQLK